MLHPMGMNVLQGCSQAAKNAAKKFFVGCTHRSCLSRTLLVMIVQEKIRQRSLGDLVHDERSLQDGVILTDDTICIEYPYNVLVFE